MVERPNSKDAMEKLLARGLRQGLDTTGKDCPDAGILATYFERALNADEMQRWELHFSTCGRCQEQLAALVRSEPEIAAPTPAPFRVWRWQWLAPLAAGAAAVALWIAVKPPEPTPMATARPAEAPPVVSDKNARLAAEPEKPKKELADKPEAPTPANLKAPPPASPADTLAAHSKAPTVVGGLAAGKEGAAASARAEADTAAKFGERRDAGPPPAAGTFSASGQDRQIGELKAQDGRAAAQQNAAEASRNRQNQTQVAREEAQKTDQIAPRAAIPSSADEGRQGVKKERTFETYEQEKRKQPSADAKPASGFVLNAPALSKMQALSQFAAPDGKTMWRYSGGDLQASADSGQTWTTSLTPAHPITAGVCVSAKVCWAVGESGLVLRTTDGTNWETVSAPSTANLTAVKASDGSKATVTAADGKSFETSDSGKTWKSLK